MSPIDRSPSRGRHYRRYAVAGVAAVALAVSGWGLGGCGMLQKSPAAAPSPSTAPPSATSAPAGDASLPDLCTLLTKDEINALVSVTATSSGPEDSADVANRKGKGCVWYGSNTERVVSITLFPTTKADFDNDASAYQRVDGVGDGAYLVSTLLYVRHGDIEIDLDVPGDLNVKRAVAKKVIEKLTGPSPSPSPSS